MTEPLNNEQQIMWFDDFGDGDNDSSFLSNFYPSPIRVMQVEYPTGEHLFQAMKFLGTDSQHFTRIATAFSPADAKRLGRSTKHRLRSDWEAVKYDVMAAVVRLKFKRDSELAGRLLATGDRLLMEGTYWKDEVWGVDLNTPGYPGRNWLGTLLMARRAELRAAVAYPTAKHNLLFIT